MTDYDGADVIDADGNTIGTVEDTYVDQNGAPRYVEVKMGSLLAKHRLVPLDQASLQGNGLHVPYSKSMIEDSPDASDADGSVGAGLLDSVEAFYAGSDSSNSSDDSGESFGDKAKNLVSSVKSAVTGTADSDSDSNGDVPVVVAHNTGEVADIGDAYDVPILEDVPGGTPIVKEILRIPKHGGEQIVSGGQQENVVTTTASTVVDDPDS